MLDVHRDVAGVELAAFDDPVLVFGIVLHLDELRRRDAVAEHVDLALLEPQQRHGRLLADLEGDAVEIGHALAPVVGVLLEDEALAERPLGELVGAGADRILAEIGAELLDRLPRHDMREVDRHDVQEGRVRPRQLNWIVSGSTTVMPESPSAVPADASSKPAIDPKKPAPGLCVAGSTTRSIEYFTSSAVISRPLWNFTPGPKLEGEGHAVFGDLVALGEIGAQRRGARLVVHEPVEQALDHRPVLPVVADRRIERGDVVLVGDDDLAAGFWRLRECRRGRKQCQYCYPRKQNFPHLPLL